uniref:Transmembrane cell adhesion receptor mua-3 n=1 Tax=Ditylenchus dipsaci TaxID=166011 RepID=A0A915D433_9BILA
MRERRASAFRGMAVMSVNSFIVAFLLLHQLVAVTMAVGSDPCQDYTLHDCDSIAECYSEQPGYFQCRCPKGFIDVSPDKRFPGRKCKKEVNECALGTHECDSNADCLDTSEGYSCRCKSGWTDVSASSVTAPGRQCKRSDLCKSIDCAPEAECRESPTGADISKQHGRPPGRVCRIVVNECEEHKHDCSANAACIDTADAFTCRCNDGYRDDSPNLQDKPGRMCTKAAVPPAPECNVNDPMSCDKNKYEVCLFMSGTYKCACPNGYSRLPNGKCLAVNECQNPRLNDCSQDADCVDQAEGYTCQCKSGFADVSPESGKPGRLCHCDSNAVCVDTEEGYSCRCRPGFADISEVFNKLPGRKCVEAINECLDAKLNDCDENSICEDAKEGYTCKCKQGFVDASSNTTHYPGRTCNKPNDIGQNQQNDPQKCDPAVPNTCGPNAACNDVNGEPVCECLASYSYFGGTCRQLAACDSDSDCDRNAICANVFDSFKCQCKPGYHDISPDAELKPGRVCKELINECASDANECSPFAECVDAAEGYSCVCSQGYVDTSSQHGLLPGRKCSNASNECLEKALNTCDENADCIDTPDAYTCQCFNGYIDVSSNAHLPPGRVCTVETTCPKQKTDLMFLIDGSGSIGSYVFKNEVLRFVRDFLELFDVGLDNTRVGLIQYSDQIRHEFDLNQYGDKQSLLQAIAQTQYLTGLTRTGAAIQHMVLEDVSRVAIVLTDGRSQDNVSEPAKAARNLHVNMFSIGVTDHVLASELESIAGSPNRWFYVDRFKDLDMRLRSLIQKLACPAPAKPTHIPGVCNPRLRQVVTVLSTRCVWTQMANQRASAPKNSSDTQLLIFVVETCAMLKYVHPVHTQRFVNPLPLVITDVFVQLTFLEICDLAYVCPINSQLQKPRVLLAWRGILTTENAVCLEFPCDVRKREKCLLHLSGQYYTCQCQPGEKRDSATQVCLVNECLSGQNDCAVSAKCIDTNDGYICACPSDYLDQSEDPVNRPGRECPLHRHSGRLHLSLQEWVCGLFPNPQNEPGLICNQEINECDNPQLNTCHPDAICVDTTESYKCICKPGFEDLDELRNPGRQCQNVQRNDQCEIGKNECDRNAKCIFKGAKDYSCICPPGYRDKSPDPVSKPGRVCIPLIPECDNPSLNDCDSPDRAICTDTDDGYLCRCRQGFLDISPNIATKPGRLCKALDNECTRGTHDCARDGGICEDTPDSYTCRCAVSYLDVSVDRKNRPGRNCKKLTDECANGQNDCSRDAICTDTEDSYICACPSNYIDVSPDMVHRPGRRCQPNINECTKQLHDCSPNANCVDTPESFTCTCGEDFVDESPNPTARPGRICRPALVDECRLQKHDCHSDAVCQDLAQGYTCQCKAQFLDESPHRVTHPGRLCVPKPTPPPDECRVDSSTSCKVELNEVCRFVSGVPKCTCPINYNRDRATNACTIINECQFPQLNDCHPSAECIDQPISYTCKCRQGFRDLSSKDSQAGTVSQCLDLEEGFDCKCNQGFKDMSPERPGRICHQMINECARPDMNSCDKNARCTDLENGYRCECQNNFLDVSPSPTLPGRACRPIVNECLDSRLNDCDKIAKCIDTADSYTCQCPADSRDISRNPVAFPGRVCLVFVNECAIGKNDCDVNADCHDNEQSYTCECKPGYTDRSPNKLSRSGRVCVRLVDECKEEHILAVPKQNAEIWKKAILVNARTAMSTGHQPCPSLVVSAAIQRPVLPTMNAAVQLCASHWVATSTAVLAFPVTSTSHQLAKKDVFVLETNIAMTPNSTTAPEMPYVMMNHLAIGVNASVAFWTNLRLPRCEDECVSLQQHHNLQLATPAKTHCSMIVTLLVLVEPQVRRPTLTWRVCVLTEPICLDATRNDCHPAAICSENKGTSDGYTCRCRDGYVDQSPNKRDKPGRVCTEQVNECLDRNLNDCDAIAVCEDLAEGYTCRCPITSIDQFPDPRRPGRRCFLQINECANPSQNNCSRFADCIDKQNGYDCKCRNGYHDENPAHPGTVCNYIINECESPNLNDCHRNAECIDLPGGYDCRCKPPYKDEGPRSQPGRMCLFNECQSPRTNDCPANSVCRDLEDGFKCECKDGFYEDRNAAKSTCIAFQENPKPTQVPKDLVDTFDCGLNKCKLRWVRFVWVDRCVPASHLKEEPAAVKSARQSTRFRLVFVCSLGMKSHYFTVVNTVILTSKHMLSSPTFSKRTLVVL